jgi:type I restriction enzyme, S subunit
MSRYNSIKLKYVTQIYTGNSIPDDKKHLYEDKIIPYVSTKDINLETQEVKYENGMTVNEEDGFKFANKNSILLCIEGGSAGKKIAYVDRKVAFVNKLCCFDSTNINSRFLYYSLQSDFFLNYFYLNMGGLIGGVSQSVLRNLEVTSPNLDTQLFITNQLDMKVDKLINLISNQQQQIEKLEEYKQSLISEVVTKGLNPSIEMEVNRFEWIGVTPKSWKTIRIKDFTKLKGRIGWQGLTTKDYIDEGPFLVTGTDFYNGIINWNTCEHISDERYNEAPEIHLMEGDLLITKDGTIGKVAVVKDLIKKASLNSGVLLIRVLEGFEFDKTFLYYVLQSSEFWVWYNSSQTGSSTIKHLYQNQFSYFAFTYPSFNEQKKISRHLNEIVSKIDSLVVKKNQKIIMLYEYKKSLIYEYVTGKKEV